MHGQVTSRQAEEQRLDESSLALVVAGLYRREVGLEHRLQSSPMGLDVLVGQLVVTLLE